MAVQRISRVFQPPSFSDKNFLYRTTGFATQRTTPQPGNGLGRAVIHNGAAETGSTDVTNAIHERQRRNVPNRLVASIKPWTFRNPSPVHERCGDRTNGQSVPRRRRGGEDAVVVMPPRVVGVQAEVDRPPVRRQAQRPREARPHVRVEQVVRTRAPAPHLQVVVLRPGRRAPGERHARPRKRRPAGMRRQRRHFRRGGRRRVWRLSLSPVQTAKSAKFNGELQKQPLTRHEMNPSLIV